MQCEHYVTVSAAAAVRIKRRCFEGVNESLGTIITWPKRINHIIDKTLALSMLMC